MVSSESLQRGWEFTAEKGNPPRSGLPDFIQGAQYGDRSLHLHAMGRIRDRQRGNEGLGRLAGRHAGGSQGGRRSIIPFCTGLLYRKQGTQYRHAAPCHRTRASLE